jgi:23S rRNA (pseudouridine1915-N3)-methyltransferase
VRLRSLLEEYSGRLSRFTKCELAELREGTGAQGSIDESKRIKGALPDGSNAILLDVNGRQLDSHELAAEIARWQQMSIKETTFIIGGPQGVSAELSARVDQRWSLSRLTLTHEMARVLLVEQLYRAYTILHGLPYQK